MSVLLSGKPRAVHNRILKLAFPDSKIIQAILDGKTPLDLTFQHLTKGPALMLGITTR